ncbi:SOS response-associated peptidase family protein [uncultured Empedobacter sp.]|uniref:SOS response-associated peptidase n=1 Tax=uncultured Empedobacter sp. TaxID=410844 RepID=UPI002600ECC3|nr:SOS response-associated peptidase family protein [uncultured Empedobacter sp.]
MCFHVKISKTKEQLEKKSKLKFKPKVTFTPNPHFKGFDHPQLPVITDKRDCIEMFEWGLLPSWGKDDFDTNNTLNARIETLEEKPSFRDSFNQRCVLFVDGFYEWRHEGKSKIKYDIGINNNTFFLAGIYNNETFSLVTTEAIGIMDFIHNTKHRMPIALNDNDSLNSWLNGEPVTPFTDFSYIEENPTQQLLLF